MKATLKETLELLQTAESWTGTPGQLKKFIQTIAEKDLSVEQIQYILGGPLEDFLEMHFGAKVSRHFDPEKFIGRGWRAVSNWTGRGVAPSHNFDVARFRLITVLEEGENSINGEEKLERLKKGNYSLLGAEDFFVFWKNLSLIPESWGEKVCGKMKFIHFDKTTLLNPLGHCFVLVLSYTGVVWQWDAKPLEYDCDKEDLSAVILP